MRERTLTGILMVTALALAAPASGIELNYGSRVEGIWEDNVFFSSNDEVDDFSFRASPFFEFDDDTGELQWDFRYSPSYEYFLDQSPLRGWDHDIRGSVSWQPTDRLTISVNESFQRFGSQARLNQETSTSLEDPSAGLEFLSVRRRIKRNVTGASIRYLPTKRSALIFAGNWTLWDYAQENRRDQETTSASAQYLYAFTERIRAGITGSWSRQEFDGVPAAPRDTRTDYYNLSGTAIVQISPTMELSISAGPAKVDGQDPEDVTSAVGLLRPAILDPDTGAASLIRASSCPQMDGFRVLADGCEPEVALRDLGEDPIVSTSGLVIADGVSPLALYPELDDVVTVPVFGSVPSGTDDITYFADISLTKTWEDWELRLGYQRRDDATSGFGIASVSDFVNGVVRYRPSPLWTFTLTGSWQQRTQEQELVRIVSVLDPRSLSADPAVRATAYTAPIPALQPVYDLSRMDPGATAFPGAGAFTGALVDSFDSEIEFTTIRVALDARRRLTKRLTVFSTLFYFKEKSTGDLDVGRDADRFTVRFGVIFSFDPIRFAGI